MEYDEIHEVLSIKSYDSSHIQFFMVQSCLLLRGVQENDLQGRVPTFWGGG